MPAAKSGKIDKMVRSITQDIDNAAEIGVSPILPLQQ
jgi:hypothetical protein